MIEGIRQQTIGVAGASSLTSITKNARPANTKIAPAAQRGNKRMNFWGHLSTINHHKRLVMQYCFRLGLYRQGLMHDLSKYNPAEFCAGVKYYQGNRSPNDAQRRALGYSPAWLHHKGRNKHHLEYWLDYNIAKGGEITGMEMPVKYVAEMLCDRIAACKVYLKDDYTDAAAWDYYAKGRDRYLLHENTRALLEQMLLLVKEKGEDEALATIRRDILHR